MKDLPDGYKILDGYFDWELKVKRTDLAFNISTKCWEKVKASPYRPLGIVKDYWFVARKVV